MIGEFAIYLRKDKKYAGVDIGTHVAMSPCKDNCNNDCETCTIAQRLKEATKSNLLLIDAFQCGRGDFDGL